MKTPARPLAGVVFHLLGRLPSMTKEQAKEWIHARGGVVVEWLSKNIDFVVAGDCTTGELEMTKAGACRAGVLEEEDLIAMGGGMDEGRKEEKERSAATKAALADDPRSICETCHHDRETHHKAGHCAHAFGCASECRKFVPRVPRETPLPVPDMVHSPKHYGGKDDPYEVIKVLRAWGHYSNAPRFNSIKYLARAGKKGDVVEDIEKAIWYSFEEIAEERRRRGEKGATLDSVARAWLARREGK